MPGGDRDAGQFEWRKPGAAYELRGNGKAEATLQFEPPPTFSWEFKNPRAARATAGDGRWRFTVSRHGFSGALGWSAVVRVRGTQNATIELSAWASRGYLRIDGRQTFHWEGKPIRGATSVFSLDDSDSTPVVLFRSGSPFDGVITAVEVTRRGLELDEWRLLSVLGFYLRMLMGRTFR
jgi:hypothetical protein